MSPSLLFRRLNPMRHLDKTMIIIIAVIVFFKMFIYNFNLIPSGSMMPLIMERDFVTVNKLAYHFRLPFGDKVLFRWADPQVGDIVTFDEPQLQKYMIKRIIAKGGDTVEYLNREFRVNGKPLVTSMLITKDDTPLIQAMKQNSPNQGFVFNIENNNEIRYVTAKAIIAPTPDNQEILDNYIDRYFRTVVPEHHYFVAGDNRNESVDSRLFASIHRDTISGKAHYLLFSLFGNNPTRFAPLQREPKDVL